MKKIFSFSILFFLANVSFSQNINLTLRSQLDFTNIYSNLWGYVDTAGNEYALVGTWQGVSVINVTDASNPVIVSNIPSVQPISGSIVYREIKVYHKHAYVTNEKDSGLLIIDLTNLPNNNITFHHFSDQGLKTAHTLWIDENGILYLFGFNTYNVIPQSQQGVMMFDLNMNPDTPQYIAQYNGEYMHDGFVRGDTLWASEIFQGKLFIFDVGDKTNFQVIGQLTTPQSYTNNSWPTSDNHFVFTTDQKPNSYLTCYNVSDLGNISETDKAQSNPGGGAIIHNVHLYDNDFAVCSYFRDGVVIFDVSDPDNIIETGNYDTCPLSGNGVDGDFGVYPFFPSKNIIVSDMQNGLFVFTPNYQKACRLKGTVTDSVTTILLNNVHVELLQPSILDSTNYLGVYNTGLLNHGLYDVQFSKAGYVSKIFYNVQLDSAQTTALNVLLQPDSTSSISENNNGDMKNDFQIYPNPATENITFHFLSSWRNCSVTISNLTGKIIYKNLFNQNTEVINLKSFSSGVYFIKISSEEFSSTKKLIVL